MYKYKYKYKYGVPDQGGYGLANDPVATRQAVPKQVRVTMVLPPSSTFPIVRDVRFTVSYVDSATKKLRDMKSSNITTDNRSQTLTFDNRNSTVYVVIEVEVLTRSGWEWQGVEAFITNKPITCYEVDGNTAKEVLCPRASQCFL
jgi:hypothetical protein